jgi:hypothetical protein
MKPMSSPMIKTMLDRQIVAAGMRRNACVKDARTPATIRPRRGL